MAESMGKVEEIDMKYVTTIQGHEYIVDILDEHHVSVDGQTFQVDFLQIGNQPVYSLVLDGQSFDAHVNPNEDTWQVLFRGNLFTATVEDEREKGVRASPAGR